MLVSRFCVREHTVGMLSQIGVQRLQSRLQLPHIRRIVAHRCRHDDPVLTIGHRLCVVALLVPFGGCLHDPSFRVGEVVLGFWLGLTHGAFERLAFLTAARFVVSGFPSRFLVRSHLTLFEPLHGRLDRGQSLLARRQPLGQTDAEGAFELSGVASGGYTLTMMLSGFSDTTVDDVTVVSGALDVGAVELRLASFGDTVVVRFSG